MSQLNMIKDAQRSGNMPCMLVRINSTQRMMLVACSGEDGPPAVKFLDFEYAGYEGSAFYPRFLHPDVPWPTSVHANEPVTQFHDRQLL